MCSSFSLGGEKPTAPATPAGDFGIGPEQLVMMSKDHNTGSLQEYGGASFQFLCVSLFDACLYFILFLCMMGNCIRLKDCQNCSRQVQRKVSVAMMTTCYSARTLTVQTPILARKEKVFWYEDCYCYIIS